MKISILTVVFEDPKGLKKTLESIFSQNYEDLEIIVIDGGSLSKEMNEIFNIFADKIKLISEKDNGIYDAMNKGAMFAKGEWAIFLNAGDTFYENSTLNKISTYLIDPNCTYYGRAKIIDENSNAWFYPSINVDESNITKWLSKRLPNHQAMFFPFSFYSNNKFDTTISISADSNYKIKALLNLSKFLDIPVCNFYLGGASSNLTIDSLYTQFRERLDRQGKYGGLVFATTGLLKSLIKITCKFIFREKAHKVLYSLKAFILKRH